MDGVTGCLAEIVLFTVTGRRRIMDLGLGIPPSYLGPSCAIRNCVDRH